MTVNIPQLGQDVEQVTDFLDYKEVDGIKLPFRLRSSSSIRTSRSPSRRWSTTSRWMRRCSSSRRSRSEDHLQAAPGFVKRGFKLLKRIDAGDQWLDRDAPALEQLDRSLERTASRSDQRISSTTTGENDIVVSP